MIDLKCPKCGQDISVQESLAGQHQPCPGCGNVNIIPGISDAEGASPQPAPPATPPGVGADKEAWTWAMWCHLAGLAMFTSIPFANILAPLVLWQIKKDEHPFIDQEGKEALNFQISMGIFAVVAFILCFVIVGFFLLIAVVIFDVVQVALAASKAGKGQPYRYPLTIRFIS